MDIAASGEYLGALVGPAAGEHSIWRKPAAKGSMRVLELARAGASVSTATDIYNKYVHPVLGQFQQLFPTPKVLLAKEAWTLRKIWHLPPQCMSRADIFAMANWAHSRPMSMLPRGTAR
eukprot:1553582-Pyramimonas_sp.AAC.1